MKNVNKKEYKKPEVTELSVGTATLNPAYKGIEGNESASMMAQAGIGPS